MSDGIVALLAELSVNRVVAVRLAHESPLGRYEPRSYAVIQQVVSQGQRPDMSCHLLEHLQNGLGYLIGLRQHGRRCLIDDVVARVGCAFSSKISIAEGALGTGEVLKRRP